jgi:hypothetical protein
MKLVNIVQSIQKFGYTIQSCYCPTATYSLQFEYHKLSQIFVSKILHIYIIWSQLFFNVVHDLSLKSEVFLIVTTQQKFTYWIKGIFYGKFFREFLKAIVFSHCCTMGGGSLLNILIEEFQPAFCTEDSLTDCTWSFFLSLLWIESLVWYLSGLLITNFIISRTYKLGTVNICNFLNFSLKSQHHSYYSLLQYKCLM